MTYIYAALLLIAFISFCIFMANMVMRYDWFFVAIALFAIIATIVGLYIVCYNFVVNMGG